MKKKLSRLLARPLKNLLGPMVAEEVERQLSAHRQAEAAATDPLVLETLRRAWTPSAAAKRMLSVLASLSKE